MRCTNRRTGGREGACRSECKFEVTAVINPAIARKRRAEKRPWTAQNQAKIEPKSFEISAKGPPEAPTAPRIAKVAVLERKMIENGAEMEPKWSQNRMQIESEN